MHEVSERGDRLRENCFGETVVQINGLRIPVHHGTMPKIGGDEALEVADFIVQAAGRQALRWGQGNSTVRRDYQAIFQADPSWTSVNHINQVELQAS